MEKLRTPKPERNPELVSKARESRASPKAKLMKRDPRKEALVVPAEKAAARVNDGGPKAPKPPKSWTAAKPDTRGNAPVLVSDLLFGLQSYVAKETGAYFGHERWRTIAGERIAQNSRVGKNYHGTLTIQVASSAWCSELSFLEKALLEKLFNAGYEVKKLRFVLDPDARDKKAKGLRAAFVEKKRTQEAREVLPPELLAKLDALEDPNLRATIAAAARASLAAQAKPPSENPPAQPIKSGSKAARQTSKRSSSS